MSTNDFLQRNSSDSEEIALLKEWFACWEKMNEMPDKMPNFLHTRTVILLARKHYEE